MKKSIFFLIMLASGIVNGQQKEIRLYSGAAPGSEGWTWREGINNKNSANVMTIYNVVHPTLTAFLPDPAVANGTAIIIAPGGGFHFLAIDHEGTNAARLLVKKGVTVFILKYRLVHILTDNPFDDMLNAKDPKAWDDEAIPVIPLAIADGKAAIAYVRSQSAEYKIAPDKIGFMGFSAGGLVAAATAFKYNKSDRPDFVVPVYADIPESIQSEVATDAPPLFIACTQDDEFGFATHAVSLYQKWYAAKRPVELHLFSKGGHGFGIGNQANTTYQWIDKLGEWMIAQSLMKGK
ncbi:MAG: alpha/beta hydrolase [Cyclobacteriaceae bacterium]|nr:alpha/beta hydrolase [Cyclobacteriaceae bacterium]